MRRLGPQLLNLKIAFTQHVLSRRGDSVRVTVKIDSATIESNMLAPADAAQAVHGLHGLTGTVIYDARLHVLHVDVPPVAGVSPLIANQFGNIGGMMFQLPDEPVGVGDSWTSDAELPLGAMLGAGGAGGPTAHTKLRVQRIDTSGADTTILVAITTSFPRYEVALPSGGGVQQKVRLSSGELSGEQLWSLTRGAALRTSMEGAIHFAAIGPQGTVQVTAQQSSTVVLRDGK